MSSKFFALLSVDEMEEVTLLQFVLGMLSQIKLYHWATMSYAKHKALDELHGSMSSKVDRLVECYLGRLKKQPLKTFHIETKASSDTKLIEKSLDGYRNTLITMRKEFDKMSELQNILDEMIADLDQAAYLLRLT